MRYALFTNSELIELHDEHDPVDIDAESITASLRNDGFDDSPLPGGVHLARSKIDEMLQAREGRSSSHS